MKIEASLAPNSPLRHLCCLTLWAHTHWKPRQGPNCMKISAWCCLVSDRKGPVVRGLHVHGPSRYFPVIRLFKDNDVAPCAHEMQASMMSWLPLG